MAHNHKQKIYTSEFKREAVRLLQTSGKSGAVIAEELGISDGSLYTWRKQLTAWAEEAKATKPRPRNSFISFAPRLKDCVKKEIFLKEP